MSVRRVRFLPDDISISANIGDSLLDVAEKAGVYIPTGCLMGSCHACTVEISGGDTIRACISAVPPGREELTVNLFSDPTW